MSGHQLMTNSWVSDLTDEELWERFHKYQTIAICNINILNDIMNELKKRERKRRNENN